MRTRTTAGLAVLAALAGCTEYGERRDTISASAGNAMAANRAIQTVDPWPAASRRTDGPTSARRAIDAVERYEAPRGPAGSPPGLGGAPGGFVPGIPAPGAAVPGGAG